MRLPSGYTQLEYIESSGTQYIDTGFKPNNNTRVVADAEYLSDAGTNPVLFGGRTAANSKTYVLIYTGGNLRSDYNTEYTQTWDVTITGRRIFDKNKETTTIDGVSKSYTNAAFQGAYNMYLLSLNNAGMAQWYASARIYSCQIYDNGTLTRAYTPCKDESGAVGLYDAVTGSFYGNSGTGVFIAGPEVAQPDIPLPEIAVSVSSATADSVTIAWNAVEGAAGYRVYRDGVLLDSVTVLTYTDTAPTAYAQHIYAVAAYGADGDLAVGTAVGASIWPSGLPPLVTDRGPGTYYTAVDLNRVETAVQYLMEQLNAAPGDLKDHAAALDVAWDALFDVPYSEITVDTNADWTALALPTRSQMERYLSNVTTVKAALTALYPPMPDSMGRLTYTGANNIEQTLVLLYGALQAEIDRITRLIDNTAAAWYYAGEIYAGEI